MIDKPKKERRFLKTLGKIGEILIQEVLIKVGSNLIKRIGGKKTLPSILFLFLSISLFAQFPNTGNKQRLGFQTTADGLVWRGSISDTASIQPVSNQNAWVILDTVNLKFYSFDFSSNVWNQLPSGTTIDTTSLSNRINLKLNIADTATMLTNYLRSGVASNTYLPLAGGTLTGALNGTTGTFASGITAGNISPAGSPIINAGITGTETNVHFYSGLGTENNITTLRLTNSNGSFFQNGLFLKSQMLRGLDEYNAYLGIMNTNFLTFTPNSRIGVFQGSPSYAFDINGTLGVTGATTLTGALNGTTGNFSTSLGVGTATSPLGTLEVYKSNSGGLGGNIFLNNNGGAVSNSTALIFGDGSSSSIRGAISTTTENLPYNGQMEFKTGLGEYSSLNTRMIIKGNGNVGIGTTSPNALFDVRGSVIINEDSGDFDTRIESDGNANMVFVDASTDRVGIGTNTPSKTLDVNGEVKIATVTATPTALLGKDASNVVGEVTTVAQTGLMTRGSTTETTGTPSAVFTVTHGLGSNPTSVIVTGTGASGAEKLIYEVYAKNSTTFSVQVWTYLGTEAASTSVTIYWLAIK
jgi:hypothetical protein